LGTVFGPFFSARSRSSAIAEPSEGDARKTGPPPRNDAASAAEGLSVKITPVVDGALPERHLAAVVVAAAVFVVTAVVRARRRTVG
jgi:hypothetical protein